ncbi:nectin-3-like [Aphelocoma coerulescens]
MSFPGQLLHPTMIFPLLFWAEICLLLLWRGCQRVEPAVALKEPIQSDTFIVAALGGEANFYCNFSLWMDVLQVTWQKRNGTSFQNMATYSPIHGLRLIGSFKKKVRFTRATPKASAITLQNLTLEDESYYKCIFNVFRHGSISKDIRLNIQTISELTVEFHSLLPTEGLLTAVCSATGKPAPNITWLHDRGLEESPEIHHIQNTNRTVTVSSRVTFSAKHPHALFCLLDHPQGRKMKALHLEKGGEDVQKNSTVIITSILTAVLLLSVLIYCGMRLNNSRRNKQKTHRTPTTPAKETGSQQDLGERASESLHTPKEQHITYQNEKQTPGSTLRKRWNGNLGLRKIWRPLFPEETQNLNSSFQSELKSGPAGLSIKELGCSPMKQDGEAMACEGVQVTPQPSCSPAQQRKDRHQPAPQAQRSTGAHGLLRSPH